MAQRVWTEAMDSLALAIANYVTLLDPELVVVGGGMADAGDSLFDPLRARTSQLVRFGAPPPIVKASLGEEAGRVGAAIQAWRAAGASEDEALRLGCSCAVSGSSRPRAWWPAWCRSRTA